MVLAAALVAACIGDPQAEDPTEPQPVEPQVEQTTRAAGEVVDGIPNYQERTVLHMTNRIRAGMHCGSASLVCGDAPLRPVQWNHNLGRAAHWHAQHLHDVPCFQHQTCCYLETVGGQVQCNSQGPTCPGGSCNYTNDCPGTAWNTRVSMFGGSVVSENIAAGSATAEATICQWLNSPGHRTNMCNASRGSLGTGYYGGSNCYGHYWVQNFGSDALTAGLASGSHWGTTASPTFGAAYYHSGASGPPQRSAVVIDGVCHDLTREYGNDTSGTYAASISVASGCHAYWFLFVSSGGTRYAYPTTGSYLLGSGCGVYTPDQAGADCEGGTGNCTAGDSRACYTGSAATRGVGACQDGTQSCVGGTWGTCQGEVLPSPEACDGVDNDCNGTVDDPCDCTPGQSRACGPPDEGDCVPGSQTCATNGTWNPCQGGTGPSPEVCDGRDNDCDGVVDNDCIPTDGGVTPTDGGVTPTDGGVTPTDGATPGPDSRVRPDGGGPTLGVPYMVGGCHCDASGPGGSLPGALVFALLSLFALGLLRRQ